jgi:two-component system, sensor histidine kinase PdtaS
MKENLRNSGIDIVGDVPWGTHFCQLYQTKEDLMDILLPYFRAGLENNEFCVWVTSEPLDSEEAKDDLRRTVPDFDTYLENGQIEVIPYTQGYVKDGVLDSKKILNGWIEKTNQTLDSGYEGLRLSGNSFWLETNWEDFVCYEREVDSAIGKYHMMALCTYSLDNCNITGIADLVSNHQFVLAKKEGKWARIDNSGRNRAEEAEDKLKETLDNSENLVKERTAELEESYKSLLENEIRLNEAQKMAHIGSWDWDIITDKMY